MSDIPMNHDDIQDNRPIYYFASGFNADVRPTVDAIKSWPGGQESFTVSQHDTFQAALDSEAELVALKQDVGLKAAMQAAEQQAVAGGHLDPARDDPRLFTDGPPDPFTTLRQQELGGLNYGYDIVPQAHGTVELQSVKTWSYEGNHGLQSLALGEYDRPSDARAEQQMLEGLRAEGGLEAEMQAVEQLALENSSLDAQRADPRLFTDGPPDPFTTLRQGELEATNGYYFRSGPALDDDLTGETHSLSLVHVERDGVDYTARQVEFMQVAAVDGDYTLDAAGRFNRMLHDLGPGPAAAAATSWASEHGVVTGDWEPIEPGLLDEMRTREPPMLSMEGDTQPLPAAPVTEIDI